jgi:hypothetical protein
MKMSVLKKPEIPIIIAFIVGMVTTFEYFYYDPIWRASVNEIQKWATILITFSLVIGTVNLLRLNSEKIIRRNKDWLFSIVLIISFFTLTVIGLYSIFFSGVGLLYPLYTVLFNDIMFPLQICLFGLLGFYVISASWRAFRAQNLDGTLLLVSAFLVMLGQAPVGEAIWNQFPAIKTWIMDVPNTAGSRAVTIGVAIGAISIAIQILLGFERHWLGRGE